MLGQLVLALTDLGNLFRLADIAAAMSVEGLLGTDRVFADDLQRLRPHPGQAVSAANITRMLAGSADRREPPRAMTAHWCRTRTPCDARPKSRVPHGTPPTTRAVVAERELASVIDNPVITLDGRVESNGNFHGAPVAYVLDFLSIVVADLASISERRTDRFLDVARNHGLNPFLADDPGVDSGHMITQYTQAAIVSELKRLAAPASVDSIPSSAMQEDHVSMGWSAARKLRRGIDGLTQVLAIEVLNAARGIELRGPLTPAPGTAAVIAAVREHVQGAGARPLSVPRDRCRRRTRANRGARPRRGERGRRAVLTQRISGDSRAPRRRPRWEPFPRRGFRRSSSNCRVLAERLVLTRP